MLKFTVTLNEYEMNYLWNTLCDLKTTLKPLTHQEDILIEDLIKKFNVNDKDVVYA